ncbi:hypothetical protein ScPMuIL_003131, partial [Solemya velum]
FWNPNSAGIDAFTANWGEHFGLFVSPITLISRVLKQMQQQSATGVLVLPHWTSSSFWPLLCGKENLFIKNVIDYIELPGKKEYYTISKTGSGIFGNKDLYFRMLALKLDFS